MISIEKVKQAANLIKGKVIRTPLVYSPSLSHMVGGEIYLKLENLQKTGSFKIRGATYCILKNKVLLQFSWRRGSKDSRGQGFKCL
jgi:threonine dehydratase